MHFLYFLINLHNFTQLAGDQIHCQVGLSQYFKVTEIRFMYSNHLTHILR